MGTLIAAALAGIYAKRAAAETKRGADEAAKAATAASTANELSKQFFINQDRPWLFVESHRVNFMDWRSGAAPFEWHYRIVNYGKSPALLTEVEYSLIMSDSAPGQLPSFAGPSIEVAEFRESPEQASRQLYNIGTVEIISSEGSTGEITAGHSTLMRRDASIPEEVLQRRNKLYMLTSHSLGFYLYGVARYADVHNVQHATAFCFRCNGPWGEVTQAGGDQSNYRS